MREVVIRMRSVPVIPTVLAILLFTSRASAQSSDAELALQDGRAAIAKGNLELACTKFAESDRLAPSARAVSNLADCFERRGLLASAYAKHLDAASRAAQSGHKDAERLSRERAARLEGRVGRMSIVVAKESEAPGLEIRRDGALLSAAAWNVPELADPGTTHTYEASAPGRPPWTATLTIEEGKTASAELRWASATANPALETASPAESSARAGGGATRSLAYVALGASAAGLVVGVVGGLQVLSAKRTVDSHCAGVTRTCDQEGLEAAARGSTWSIVSPIGFGVAALGLGAFAYLWIRSADRAPAKSAWVTPSASPSGGGLVVGGTL